MRVQAVLNRTVSSVINNVGPNADVRLVVGKQIKRHSHEATLISRVLQDKPRVRVHTMPAREWATLASKPPGLRESALYRFALRIATRVTHSGPFILLEDDVLLSSIFHEYVQCTSAAVFALEERVGKAAIVALYTPYETLYSLPTVPGSISLRFIPPEFFYGSQAMLFTKASASFAKTFFDRNVFRRTFDGLSDFVLKSIASSDCGAQFMPTPEDHPPWGCANTASEDAPALLLATIASIAQHQNASSALQTPQHYAPDFFNDLNWEDRADAARRCSLDWRRATTGSS